MQSRDLVTVAQEPAAGVFPTAPLSQHPTAVSHYVPRTSRNIVDRARLTIRLDNPSNHALTLLIAPTGFGKTTLLASWLRTTRRRIAWLSIDERDAGLRRFVFHIFEAFRHAVSDHLPEFGAAWRNANVDNDNSDWKVHASFLIQELCRIPVLVTLVLDDYHFVADDRIHKFVAELIEKLPESVSIIISSRKAPPLPLSRMRARGLLTEITTEQLRFTGAESEDYLRKIMHLDLTPGELKVLNACAEGWIVGLQLAAIGIQDGAVVADVVASASRSRRHLLVYLLEEVLQRQPNEVQTFLIQTSVLDRLTASLCNYVTDSSNGTEMIQLLQNDNLFVVSLDDEGKWFRYHHLFRLLLLEQLEHGDLEDRKILEMRACSWYESEEMIPEAVASAVKIADWEKVVELVRPTAAPLLLQTRDFREWLKTLPSKAFEQHPTLAVFLGWSRLIGGNIRGCERVLTRLVSKIPSDDPLFVQLALMRATIGWFGRDIPTGIANAKIAMDLAENDVTSQYIAIGSLGLLQSASGQPIDAEIFFHQALRVAEGGGRTSAAISMMFEVGSARSQWMRGRLNNAMSIIEDLEDRCTREESPLPHSANIVRAYIHIDRNELAEAEEQFAIAGEQIRRTGVEFNTTFYWHGIALVRLARAEHGSALEAADELLEWCRRNGNRGWEKSTEALRISVMLEQGRLDEVGHWLTARTQTVPATIPYSDESRYLLLARWYLARHPHDLDTFTLIESTNILQRLSELATKAGRVSDASQADLVCALIQHKIGNTSKALAQVSDVCQRLLPEGAIRPLFDHREQLKALLLASKGQLPSFEHLLELERLLAYDPTNSNEHKQEGSDHLVLISDREQEVLNLIAMGLTNLEIADSLVVSLNTIKTHIKNLYFKLGAHSRTQAIMAGRRSSLL